MKRREYMYLILCRRVRAALSAILCVTISSIILTSGQVNPAFAIPTTENRNEEVESGDPVTERPSEKYQPVEPRESKSENDKKKWLIIGGAAAIGIGAIAIGAGGGGGSDGGGGGAGTSGLQPGCEKSPVGPSLAGQWQGVLDLKNYGSQPVSATITQCGERITIHTSSTLPYGQNFSGSVSSGGSILLKEGVTYQIWSSHLGPATSNSLRVYDYVNNQTQLDALKLTR